MRKKIVAGNWKMNTTLEEGKQLAGKIVDFVKNNPLEKLNGSPEVMMFAPYTHIATVAEHTEHVKSVSCGAQNCHTEEKGAYTGEISVSMIKSTGAKNVLIGHSERRQYFAETNETLAKKVKMALGAALTPVYCCGEVLDERNADNHFNVVKEQIEKGLFWLEEKEFAKVVIAYEPVWAIGTGVTASPDQAQEMHAYIRKVIAEKYNQQVADNTTILYGGSCNAKNAKELFANPDVDGGLIGGASLKPDDFTAIIQSY